LRIEYANNHVSGKPNVFYAHSLYRSGYTYKSRIIGHHMGTDTRDLFVRLTHYLTQDLILGLEFDREKSLSSKQRQTIDQLGFDLTFFTSKNWRLKTGYRYENSKNSARDNHIFHLQLIHDF
jgi:outer membrane protein assembly factor BamA